MNLLVRYWYGLIEKLSLPVCINWARLRRYQDSWTDETENSGNLWAPTVISQLQESVSVSLSVLPEMLTGDRKVLTYLLLLSQKLK
jgi:hypothetical protein